MPRPRNYVVCSPLMRKGGPHIKSKTGSRVRARLKLEDIVDEWFEYSDDIENNENRELINGEPEAPQDVLPGGFL